MSTLIWSLRLTPPLLVQRQDPHQPDLTPGFTVPSLLRSWSPWELSPPPDSHCKASPEASWLYNHIFWLNYQASPDFSPSLMYHSKLAPGLPLFPRLTAVLSLLPPILHSHNEVCSHKWHALWSPPGAGTCPRACS